MHKLILYGLGWDTVRLHRKREKNVKLHYVPFHSRFSNHHLVYWVWLLKPGTESNRTFHCFPVFLEKFEFRVRHS